MQKRIPYSLYKAHYGQFPAEQYDGKSRSILVDLPERKPVRFPAEWKRDANHYLTPGGCTVYVWNTGLAQNFLVERVLSAYRRESRTIPPGINSRRNVLEAVKALEALNRRTNP